ncbi:CocE/NonD family Hydrolase [Fusarium sp. LHS14.1]|nr:CocE/NonD family Hydrolase [Fusarium sp. LHS14.1]
MADLSLTTEALAQMKRLGKFIPRWDPKLLGTRDPNPRTIVEDGIIQDLDVALSVRDGTVLRANLYRPENRRNERLPVILNYSVYGKDGAVDICVFPPASGLDASRISKLYLFEAADPGWWCHQGYAVASVDARGSHQSDGDKGYYTRDVGLDGYDVIEWLAKQPWSDGKVALYGASGYAMVIWLTVAEKPPSLAAIIPIDGMTDLYREMTFKGGIPETQFSGLYPVFWNWGRNLVEDATYGGAEHPFFDDYWKSKLPNLENIECPTYIICEKFLELHQYQKWEWSTTEESLGRQKAFLDKYLLGEANEVQFWPTVRYTMRERYYGGEWRSAKSFPIETTDYTRFFLTPSKGLSRITQGKEQSLSYDAEGGEIAFDLPITQQSLEFAGHAKLRLWVEAKGADNMDLFITLRKLDRDGNQVFFPWLTVVDTGPIGFGFLRVSRRELDEKSSTPYQPVHTHQRDLPLAPGEIVPVDIEIMPTSCHLRPGERLQVVVSSHDYGTYPTNIPVSRHPNTVNKGTHVIHFGGKYDSHLVLPVIPPVTNSYAENNKTVKMAMLASRVSGWKDEKFLHEYTEVHAGMTQKIAAQVPVLRNYIQVVVVPKSAVPLIGMNASSTSWDCSTILGWSTLKALWGSFHAPDYKASAGSHVFVEESGTIGILCQSTVDIVIDPVEFENRDKDSVLMVFYLAKNSQTSKDRLGGDITARASAVVEASSGTKLLRYALNKSVTPDDTDDFFADTPFLTADWTTMGAMEQFWFANMDGATAFLEDEKRRRALEDLPESFDLHKSVFLVGKENRVVTKDLGF